MNGTSEVVEWLPALIVALGGLIAGFMVVVMSRRRQTRLAREQELETVEDLRDRFEELIVTLRSMRESGSGEDPSPLEREAAALLQAIERREDEESSSAEASPSPEISGSRGRRRESRSWSGFAWGAGSATVIGLVLFFAMSSATEREEGGSLTGGVEAMGGTEGQQPSVVPPQVRNLEEWIATHPDDLDARLELASVYIMQQELMKVWSQTEYVLERVPGHPRAQAYQAVVRLAMGQTDVALKMLEDSIESDPTLLDARIHLALAYLQLGRSQEAVRILEEAKTVHPNQAEMIDQLLREVMQQRPAI